MDFSLLVMIAPPQNSTYLIGDIVDVSPIHNEACAHPRFVLINVTGVPNNAPNAILRKRFKGMLESSINVDFEQREVRRRAFRFKPSSMPPAAKSKLMTDRKATVDWSAAKQYITRRFVVDELDPTKDTDVFMQDEDV